jgi:hypothetical protein
MSDEPTNRRDTIVAFIVTLIVTLLFLYFVVFMPAPQYAL